MSNVAGRIGNRVSPAESACIGSGSSILPGRGLVSKPQCAARALHSSM